ncbi:MAG TPA: CoA-binding protein [Tepidisphaeraceae bacterium]|nr:CoA-binding protein [Tepidisphaeraceae bacterium]
MSNEACTLPGSRDESEEAQIRRMLAADRIAIVGLSDKPNRPSHMIGQYLKRMGKTVIPVNPQFETAIGLKCYATLADVPGPIDLVNVFRRSELCAEVARDAVAVGAKGVWLQSGIVNDDAREAAQRAGIDYVEDRCIMIEHQYRQDRSY